jgi:hypothetical protein
MTGQLRSAYAQCYLRLRHCKLRYLQELTYIIKQDIAGLNKSIAGLQAYTRQHGAGSSGNRNPEQKQADEHEANVVMLLQSKLANVSMTFKDVLEIRTQVSCTATMILLMNLTDSYLVYAEHEGEQGPNRAIHAFRCVWSQPGTIKSASPTQYRTSR